MDDNSLASYMDERYQQMLTFYDDRSVSNKKWHNICSVYIIAASLLLAPCLTIELGWLKYVASFISASIGIAAALHSHYKFHENWLRYRSTWDCMMREPHLLRAKIGGYADTDDPNALFVQRMEKLFEEEGSDWLSTHGNADEDCASSVKAQTKQSKQ